ncbi:hypothetical protein, partial [Cupriavidus sp. SK-4]|uniref:hypothetical protein n=1 Tax=Cupriavidus sp. SK-4 TaxID=574750 RepID=UPI001F3B1775
MPNADGRLLTHPAHFVRSTFAVCGKTHFRRDHVEVLIHHKDGTIRDSDRDAPNSPLPAGGAQCPARVKSNVIA